MPYCIGVAAEAWEIPEGVTCSYYTQNGAVGPEDCNGQMTEALLFKVIRGVAKFWQDFDTNDDQRIDARCGRLMRGFPLTTNNQDFYQTDGCRNTYYHDWGKKKQFHVGGYMAWD